MSARINYIGTSTRRIIKRTDLTGVGLADPGVDLEWNQGNGFQRNVANDIGLFLVAQGDFISADALNYGSASSVLGGSGVVLGSSALSAQMAMATAATAEDVPGATATFTFDGRPVFFETTPVLTGQDAAIGARLISLMIVRQSDSVIQRIFYREQETALAGMIQPHKCEMGPLVAWPSDSVPFVVGATYGIKLRISAGAGCKASTNGNTQPYSIYAKAA